MDRATKGGNKVSFAPWRRIPIEPGDVPRLLQTQLLALSERSRAIDLREWEDDCPRRVARDLVPEVSDLLGSAIECLALVLDRYDGDRDAEPDAEDCDASEPSTRERLCDITYVARGELRRRHLLLDEPPCTDDTDHAVSLCGSGLRHVRRSTIAVERALCEHEGIEPHLSHLPDLRSSLDVRRAYVKFRQALSADPPPQPENLHHYLHAAGAAIARLLGRDVSRNLRFSDRTELRKQQRRLLDWFNESLNPTAGMRIWQDLIGFAELIEQINQRSELVEYDLGVAREVWLEIFENGASAVPSGLRGALADMVGRSSEVDRLIAAESWDEVALWRRPLAELLSRLGAPVSTSDLSRREFGVSFSDTWTGRPTTTVLPKEIES